MSRLEVIQKIIQELKLYKEYLLNVKVIDEFKKDDSNKKLSKKNKMLGG